MAATVRTLVFILAWPFTQSTIVLQSPLISKVGHFPASGIPSSKRGRSLGFFVGLFRFLPHRLFQRYEQASNTVFPARFSLRHALDPVVPLASPSRHRCVPLCSSVVEPNFVLPPLNVVGVPRHTPRCPASPPSGRSPPRNGTKTQHDRDITIINGPFIGQQRETHLFQLVSWTVMS